MQITVKEHTKGHFHHLPDHQAPIDLYGLTIKKALAKIREMDFGNLGGLTPVDLSDGSMLEVDLLPAQGGGYVMSTQRARRFRFDSFEGKEKTLRKYDI